jgi:hypothetical protein
MNENIHRAQVTIGAMKLMIEALEDVGQQLPKNPKLYALLAESPIEELRRLRDELDQLLEPLKHIPAASASQVESA